MSTRTLILIMIVGYFASAPFVSASGKHRPKPDITNITNNSTNSDGVALGIASSQHRYRTSTDLQMSVGVGYYEDSSAVSLGLAGRNGDSLINGAIGIDTDGGVGAGVGISWKLK